MLSLPYFLKVQIIFIKSFPSLKQIKLFFTSYKGNQEVNLVKLLTLRFKLTLSVDHFSEEWEYLCYTEEMSKQKRKSSQSDITRSCRLHQGLLHLSLPFCAFMTLLLKK